MIVPLDPAEGERYTEPMHEEEEVDHIYNLTARDKDWITLWLTVCLARRRKTDASLTPMKN